MKEIWKWVKGYENIYQVSNLGNVKSFKRKKPKLLKLCINNAGYYLVTFIKDGKQKTPAVHRLVAENFLTIRPNIDIIYEVNHIDGDKLNNKVNNLEFVTRKQNIKHSFKNGLQISKKGSFQNGAKLKEYEVIEIRNKFSTGNFNKSELARQYKVSQTLIKDIINRS